MRQMIVDFASAKAVDHLLDYCGAHKMPLVLCTTGLSRSRLKSKETRKDRNSALCQYVPLASTPLMKLVQDAAKVLANQALILRLWRNYHNKKLDAPSGSALALADSINEAMDNRYHYKYDRSTERVWRRDENEIGISRCARRYHCRRPRCDLLQELTSHHLQPHRIFQGNSEKAARAGSTVSGRKEPGLADMQDVIG